MDTNSSTELETILATYRAGLIERQDRETEVKNARAAFVDAFRNLKSQLIGPLLEDFVAHLSQAGHQASVVDEQEESDRNGHFTPASIALRIMPARIAGEPPTLPAGSTRDEVIFSANKQTMKVLVSSSSNLNGTIGKRGDYDIAELTPEFVQSHVLHTIRAAFQLRK